MEHIVAPECKQKFESIDKWQEKVESRLKEGDDKDACRDVDIGVIKASMTSLTNSMGKLTTAIWGAVISVAATGLAFIIWFIQNGGL